MEPECHVDCGRILYYYGPRPFKCKFSLCGYWRHGFETRSLRDKHLLSHKIPLKCPVDDCEFGKVGFLSESMRRKHLQEGHRHDQRQPTLDFRSISKDDIEPLLLDLVRESRVEAVREILSTLEDPITSQLLYDLKMLAAYAASGAMLDLLDRTADDNSGDQHHTSKLHDYIEQSIQGRNISALEHLLTQNTPSGTIGDSQKEADILSELVSVDWTEGTEMWCRWYGRHPEMYGPKSRYGLKDLFENGRCIAAATKHLGGEQQLLYIWKRFMPRSNSQSLHGSLLRMVAAHSSSTILAEYLLEKGDITNYRRSDVERTALHFAAERNSSEGAQMMRFLLFHGADPEAEVRSARGKSRIGKIRDLVGPRGIHAWLGKDWDEIVEEARIFRDSEKISSR